MCFRKLVSRCGNADKQDWCVVSLNSFQPIDAPHKLFSSCRVSRIIVPPGVCCIAINSHVCGEYFKAFCAGKIEEPDEIIRQETNNTLN
jgi:hypothetical protein